MVDLVEARARLVFVFPLTAPSISVGQAADNHLVIAERGVALQHARLTRAGDTYAVEDLSGGETWVSPRSVASDLKPVTRSVLQPDALVQFGGALFRFLRMSAALFVLQREFEVRHLPATIGADPDNVIVLNAPTISRRHAEIFLDGENYAIRDQHSTNGTFVAFTGDPANERQIETSALRDRSLVRLGNVRLIFRVS